MRHFVLSAMIFMALLVVSGATAQKKEKSKREKLRCPVAGPGRKLQKDECPGGYCSRQVNRKLSADYKGKKVFFCCSGCVKQFKKSSKNYASAANLQLVATAQAIQSKCPICGEKHQDKLSMEIGGAKVHFCTEACQKKVAAQKGPKQLEMLFNNSAFEKGFTLTKGQ